MDMSSIKNMMSSNPDMQNMMKDPSVLKEAMNMFRDPKNKAMVDMMT